LASSGGRFKKAECFGEEGEGAVVPYRAAGGGEGNAGRSCCARGVSEYGDGGRRTEKKEERGAASELILLEGKGGESDGLSILLLS